jgi:hypothetical protein
MGKRSRRHRPPRLPAPAATQASNAAPPLAPGLDPERSLLQAIADGELDDHLTALGDAVHARHHLLHTVRSATALGELCVGDYVRINHTISPRYLHGLHGKVIDLDDERATVCLHRPVGRFHTGEIRCPPLTLERLPRAA